MNALIIFRSKYGATAQYAAWLSEALDIPAVPQKQVTPQLIKAADHIVIGSSIYFRKLLMRRWLRKYAGTLADKNLYFFIVSATNAGNHKKISDYVHRNIPGNLRQQARFYCYPGKIIYQQLSWLDRTSARMTLFLGRLFHKKRNPADFDHVEKHQVDQLVADLRSRFI